MRGAARGEQAGETGGRGAGDAFERRFQAQIARQLAVRRDSERIRRDGFEVGFGEGLIRFDEWEQVFGHREPPGGL